MEYYCLFNYLRIVGCGLCTFWMFEVEKYIFCVRNFFFLSCFLGFVVFSFFRFNSCFVFFGFVFRILLLYIFVNCSLGLRLGLRYFIGLFFRGVT